jgi:hypothetical protein
MTMNIAQPPKPTRRWYQFSLMTLLVVMTLLCVGFAWIGVRLHRARENRARVAPVEGAVAAIEKLGGEVTSTYKDIRPQTWLEKQFDDPGDAADPVGVLTVTGATLFRTPVTDADLVHLHGLTNLEALELNDTKITDAGLKQLKGLRGLEVLFLEDTDITDGGLVLSQANS